jgi:hypothetical protein
VLVYVYFAMFGFTVFQHFKDTNSWPVLKKIQLRRSSMFELSWVIQLLKHFSNYLALVGLRTSTILRSGL